MTGSEVLQRLVDGNRRFVSGRGPGLTAPVDLRSLVDSQSPAAAVLSCSDSRVPPHHVLDQGIGEIFVVRVAGTVPGPAVLGSLEYAVGQLKVPLLLVLGHEGCGAVKAALSGGGEGALGELVREIEPAVRPVLEQDEEVEDVMEEAVKANVWHTMNRLLERSTVIAGAVTEGRLLVKGAVYSLRTGEVALLEAEG